MTTVRDLRVQQDISQGELARRAGLGITAIVKLEKGRPVHASTLEKVCQALGVSRNEVSGYKIFSAVQAAARRRELKS